MFTENDRRIAQANQIKELDALKLRMPLLDDMQIGSLIAILRAAQPTGSVQ